MKRTLWALPVAFAVCAATSTVHAQGPDAGNPWQGRPGLPPAVPGSRDQEKRRDEPGAWTRIPYVVPRVPSSFGAPNAGGAADLHTPIVVPPEAAMPVSELRFPRTTFSPTVGEGIPTMVRGLSRFKGGGILAGIGGAIATAFGGIFGRKKES